MMKSRELRELIKVCAISGVSEFSCGDLKVVFGKPIIASHTTECGESQPTTSTIVLSDEIEPKDELRLKEDQLSMALIEDPSKYEQLLMAGELEDE